MLIILYSSKSNAAYRRGVGVDGAGVSCLYSIVINLYVSFSGPVSSAGEENAIFLLSFTCNHVVYIKSGFFILLVLRIG